jgi:hypothetical protein
MLKSMKVLPDSSITETLFSNFYSGIKGKRKACDFRDGLTSAKKCPMAEDNEEEDNEDNEDEDGLYSKDTNAMQVSEE